MNLKRKQRLAVIVVVIVGVATAVGFMFTAFDQNLMFFYTPTQVAAGEAPQDHPFRVGGLVVTGSVNRQQGQMEKRFDVTDNNQAVTIVYNKILPDLFREGQGIVALGRLNGSGEFIADEVLAKHDENYMPPEVADALKSAHEKKAGFPLPQSYQ